ncbi:MAG: hypothetical protein Q7V15_10000 [Phenylobacterium sp.]|uniref:hypothetical protein n=1 Tax=Phenylobacterium sp. TaxID=1871053 RepID=UPI00272417EE|nr:hypothetical protein [Phenylobacterium sp.]MDO8901676.1 hypothetical protein [Phenylobacterium sp.]
MLSLGPEVPAALRPLLGDLVEAVRALTTPGAPTPVFACAAADLPPAADWPERLVLVRDLSTLAVSDGAGWIRQDTGDVI